MSSDTAVPETTDLTISDLSRFYNVSPRTLRFYEEKGLLQPRRLGQTRIYSAQDLIRLELILAGKKLGFSLREIDAMIRSHQVETNAEPVELVAVLSADAIQQQLQSLERQKADIEDAIAELKGTLD